jgi:hypothetical protein
MYIVLKNFKVQSHRVINWLLGHAVIILAALGCVWVCIDERRAGEKAGSNDVWGVGAGLGGLNSAGLIPSIVPTC